MTRRAALGASVLGAGGLAVGAWGGAIARRHRSTITAPRRISPVETHDYGIAIREWPLSFTPAQVIAELGPVDGLKGLLTRLSPCWPSLKASRLIHALRLWGPSAEFPERVFPRPYRNRVLSSRDIFGIMTDHGHLQDTIPGTFQLLTTVDEDRVAQVPVPLVHGSHVGSFSHVDELIATLGDLGAPSTTPIVTPDGRHTAGDLLRQSVAAFSFDIEREWSTEAFVRYFPPERTWRDASGQTHSFDDVLTHLLAKPIASGACAGLHILQAITMCIVGQRTYDILTASVERAANQYLDRVRDDLVALERRCGMWSARWHPILPAEIESGDRASQLFGAVTSTGHLLEWICIAPLEFWPPVDVIRRAAARMLDDIATLDDRDVVGLYEPLTHFARGLCLLQGQHPVDLCRE